MPPQAGGTRHLLTALSQLGPQTHAHVSPVILTAPLSQVRTLRLRERASLATGHTTCNRQRCVSNPAVYPPCVRMRGEGAGCTSAWARCLECTLSPTTTAWGGSYHTHATQMHAHMCKHTHGHTELTQARVKSKCAHTHTRVYTHSFSTRRGRGHAVTH